MDASAPYLSAAREEATRVDWTSQLDVVAGDFVVLGATLPVAEIVAMHRVVCCYPDFDALLSAALAHSARVFAFRTRRTDGIFRAVADFGNRIRALTGKAFRTFVHKESLMHALIESRGFRREARRDTFVWQIEVWTRNGSMMR